ncbi:nickel ABC transporter substrate-binding protein [Gallintestinimicrobium propionicum]|jgi:nickel transport system substrate-binding protein
MKRITAALTAAVMAVSLAACSNNADPVGESSQPSQTDTESQAVHLNLAESWDFQYFYTIITPEVSSSSGYDITYYLTSFYDTLFEYNTDGEVVGVLAEDWAMSEDGKTYTFQIKQGVKFSDGSDLTAEDVAKSILAVPVNLGQYNGSYGRLSTIIEDAVVVDEYTVELHLTQPYYNTLRELCLANPFGIVSSEQFNEDLTAKDTFRTATYGTGPYMYAGDNDGQTWNFGRNPNYWGEAPDVDSFSIKYIPDNDAKILAMQNGEVDFLSGIKNISAESFEQMEQTEGFQAQADEKSLQTYYVGYNLSDPIFGDQTVREAISSAVDKDAIVESIYGGLYDKADTFFSRSLPYCDVEQTVYNFDLDHANQILDEAGYTDTDGDGIREKDGVKLSASFMYQTGSASDDNLVVYICDQASKIGIELTPQSAQMMDWYAMVQSGEYGLTIFKTQGGYYDPASVVTNINPATSMDPILMQIGVSQPEIAALVDELDSSADEARIQEIYSTILTTMADQCLTTPLIYTRQLTVYSDTVSSYTFPTDASFTSVQNIHLK